MANNFLCGRFEFDLERPLVMGIVNVTPDSFSDGGQHDDTDSAVAHARQLIEEGAQILDLGGRGVQVVGHVPGGLPTPSIPVVPLDRITDIIMAGVALAACSKPAENNTAAAPEAAPAWPK